VDQRPRDDAESAEEEQIAQSAETAQVTAYSPQPGDDIDSLAATPTPLAVPQPIADRRETVRTAIAIGTVVVTALLGAAGGWQTLEGNEHATDFLTGVFAPFLGVAGTVLGFYFGGKDSTS
jgi:hypothetical protein